jgi:signal transduction histidine kinase
LLACILVAVGAFVLVRLRADLVDATDRSLQPALGQIASGYRNEGFPEFHDQSVTVLSGERAASQVLSAGGGVLRSYGDAVSATPMLDRRSLRQALRGPVTLTARLGPGPRFRISAEAVTRRGVRRFVVAATSFAPIDRSVHRVLVLLLIALPAALAATAAGGWWLARRALRPIDRMVGTAESVGHADLGVRVAVPATRDEVAHLGRTLNTMLDRIQLGVEEQQRLIADTSHELRTPLATMRTELDVSLRADELSPAAREVLESTREEVDRLSAMAENLLILARADENALQRRHDPVDLARLVRQTVDRLGGRAAARNVELAADGPPVSVSGDAEHLGNALRNLVDNAIKYSPAGARVTVRTFSSDDEAGVTVADEGPGVPEDLGERIFDRFFRVDSSRTRGTGGSGLGLAIAREVVLAHGGRISVAPRRPVGSTFTIVLARRRNGAPDGHAFS